VNSNNEIQGYKLYPMLHFHRKFSSGVTAHSSLPFSPLTQALVRSPPKLSSLSAALATLQVLRRINKNYGRGSKAVIDFSRQTQLDSQRERWL